VVAAAGWAEGRGRKGKEGKMEVVGGIEGTTTTTTTTTRRQQAESH